LYAKTYYQKHRDKIRTKAKARAAEKSAYDKARYATDPRRKLASNRKSKYGVTAEEATALFVAQGERCAICLGADTGAKGRAWSLDHCHTTGKARGFLCAPCNKMLGFARDAPSVLRAAATYLEKHNEATRLELDCGGTEAT
jgi:hypothetical protein